MIIIIQRVKQAHVEVEGQTIGRIGQGLLLFLCAEQGDTEQEADKMLSKVSKLRIFPDDMGKMNRSIMNLDGGDLKGELLIISQFTLAADVWSGNRPSFTGAAKPDVGEKLYNYFVDGAKKIIPHVATGEFAADMQVHLINDGPVTIPIRVAPKTKHC